MFWQFVYILNFFENVLAAALSFYFGKNKFKLKMLFSVECFHPKFNIQHLLINWVYHSDKLSLSRKTSLSLDSEI